MRRTVATLLVVASPLLLAAPVGAREGRLAGPGNPAVVAGPLPTGPPLVPTPAVTRSVPAPTRATAAVAAPVWPAVKAVRPAVKVVRAKTPAPAALDDAAHEAQLRADLCRARAIFCGLDRGGHYPGG